MESKYYIRIKNFNNIFGLPNKIYESDRKTFSSFIYIKNYPKAVNIHNYRKIIPSKFNKFFLWSGREN